MNDEIKKHVYLSIPINYICVYNKLKYLVYNYGIDIIKDCASSCKPKNKTIVECWNLFQLAIINYHNNKIDEANNIINNIKNKIDKLYKTLSNIDYNGESDYYIDENGNNKTHIICNGYSYELPNLKIKYEFILNSQSNINDTTGRGITTKIDITSNKIISNDQNQQIEEIGYDIVYLNEEDSNWITFNSITNELIIKPNTIAERNTKIQFIQYESDKIIEIEIYQQKDNTEYKYTFEYEPKSFEFDNVGGEKQFNVRSVKQEIRDGLPVGEEISVDWIAKIEGAGFSVNNITNSVVAEANDYKTRTGKLILSRPELGSSYDVEIPITQQAGIASVIYNLQAVVNNTILPALNGQTTITVISTKQEYYGSEPIGEPIEVSFTITSERGYLKGQSSSGAVWTMTENITEQERNDALIISQSEGNTKDIKINIIQQPAEIGYVYNFSSNVNSINFDAKGGTKSINIISTKQKTINGKNYGDAEEINYDSNITSSEPNQFKINKNTITVAENALEEEKRETATFIQNESNKQINVTVILNAAKETYEYIFNISEGTSQVNFNREGGSKTFTVNSKKQKYLNGSPQGSEIDVSFEISVTGEGFSVSGTTLKADENRITTQRTGNIKFIQNESGKYIDIGIIQAAGSISYKYTFNVSPTEFHGLPNYVYGGITRNYTVASYKEKYVNDNKEGEPIDVNFTVSSNALWCHVTANNGKSFTVDENLDYARTARITLTQTENPDSEEKTKIINIFQVASTSKLITQIVAPNLEIIYPKYDITKKAIVKKYTSINGHIEKDVTEGSIIDIKKYSGDDGFIFSFNGLQITARLNNYSKTIGCTYLLSTTYGNEYGAAYYYRNTYSLINDESQDLISNIYLLIPENYSSIYYTLITLISKYHKEIKTKENIYPYKEILNCWNLFQAAVIAYSLEYYKEADFFINFIDKQISKLNINIDIPLIIKIDNGIAYKCINGNNENISFKINISTGQLIIENNTKDNFKIINNYLYQIYESDN